MYGPQRLLRCDGFYEVSESAGGVWDRRREITEFLQLYDPQVIYFGAGMAVLDPVTRYWRERCDVTCVHLGSALDPLYASRQTRQRQLSRVEAWEFIADLMREGWPS